MRDFAKAKHCEERILVCQTLGDPPSLIPWAQMLAPYWETAPKLPRPHYLPAEPDSLQDLENVISSLFSVPLLCRVTQSDRALWGRSSTFPFHARDAQHSKSSVLLGAGVSVAHFSAACVTGLPICRTENTATDRILAESTLVHRSGRGTLSL